MSDIPNDGQPGFEPEKPEHCFACYRLIRPGKTYYQTFEGIVHCEDCALSAGVIRVRDELSVWIERDRLLIRHGRVEVKAFPGEIRHLVNALGRCGHRISTGEASGLPKNPEQ